MRRPAPAALLFSLNSVALLLLQPPTAVAQTQAVECAVCHSQQGGQFAASVHHVAIRCQDCHGGEPSYDLTAEFLAATMPTTVPTATQRSAAPPDAAAAQTATTRPSFDHGRSFRGKPARRDVPALCGTCHANVERMNPYGLRTDQLASYRLSGHGKRLEQSGDDRVAVCIDCHGIHDVLRSSNPQSRTHFQRIPDTCGTCHADAKLMGEFRHPSEIVAQYRASVHGRNVLERGDAGSPNCATCHGSHGAAPPGVAQVGHVCGRCHQQVEQYFQTSLHWRLPLFPRCIGCHAKGGEARNHQIEPAGLPPETVVQTFTTVRRDFPASPESGVRTHWAQRLAALETGPRLETVCANCHREGKGDPHRRLYESDIDPVARARGERLGQTLSDAQFEYARAAERVQRVSRGVLLIRQEALLAEDAKTELVAMMSAMHAVNVDDAQTRLDKLRGICRQIETSLDEKERGLAMRRTALAGVWAFIAVFAVLMYRKYLDLKHAYVRLPVLNNGAAEMAAPVVERRRFLDATLRLLGAAGVAVLVWPVVSYVLPARRRGGAIERVSAGKEDGWAVWELRKVSVAGKAVGVVRTEKGYRAFSLVCTHLGCIVHWNGASRQFECPCHAARFDVNGRVVAGPPPRPLPEYGVAAAQGEVIVSEAAAG
ncbi:MAG: ubiquinol-cytochrome c reductase iron-sulfur subunit [Phycisphaerae bacterium]